MPAGQCHVSGTAPVTVKEVNQKRQFGCSCNLICAYLRITPTTPTPFLIYSAHLGGIPIALSSMLCHILLQQKPTAPGVRGAPSPARLKVSVTPSVTANVRVSYN